MCLCSLLHLADKLKLTQIQPLNQIITIRHRMSPLTKEEASQYIGFQLKNIGCSNSLFIPDSVESIASKSRCCMKLINNIALLHTLNYGYAKKLNVLDSEAVYSAAADFQIKFYTPLSTGIICKTSV